MQFLYSLNAFKGTIKIVIQKYLERIRRKAEIGNNNNKNENLLPSLLWLWNSRNTNWIGNTLALILSIKKRKVQHDN